MESDLKAAATVTPDMPLLDSLDMIAKRPGRIGVVEDGTVIGTISAEDILSGLTRHRR
jgi:glycine betaine/proline transport system ATP-binding protein